jgi:hypothetical protein
MTRRADCFDGGDKVLTDGQVTKFYHSTYSALIDGLAEQNG